MDKRSSMPADADLGQDRADDPVAQGEQGSDDAGGLVGNVVSAGVGEAVVAVDEAAVALRTGLSVGHTGGRRRVGYSSEPTAAGLTGSQTVGSVPQIYMEVSAHRTWTSEVVGGLA
jgi:hypothetical protein